MSVYVEEAEIKRLQDTNQKMASALKEVASWRKELEANNITKV
jgi:hypothetical protein